MSQSLSNPNGVRISELVEYLQTEYLDKGLDGEVWIEHTDNIGLTNQMVTAGLLNRSDVLFDIRRPEKASKNEPTYAVWLQDNP